MRRFLSLLGVLSLAACFAAVPVHAGKPVDNDKDGYTTKDDCNDNDPLINPGATEVCDGVDNNCDGVIDEGCSPTSGRDVIVIATNDLGMHCACPGAETFLLLPPFNTLRAQVFERGDRDPVVLADPADIRVTYNIVEDTDDGLKADPYFQSWIANAPKIFPGYEPVRADGRIQGLTGATLDGDMEAHTSQGWWEAVGIPAYPVIDPNGVMTDPLGGSQKRNPYLTGDVKVYDQATGALLAETNTVVPVAFGGCCGCHLQVAADYGYPSDPRGSFDVMGMLHEQNGSGINIAQIDVDGDGIGGPIRCSWCHVDPAMGESSAPGVPGHPEYSTSKYTFSDVVHRFHAQSAAVQAYDPDIASDCYRCHPGNNVNCFRGHHTGKTIDGHPVWCTDCHGDLNQRVAEGQLLDPWSDRTLPTCSKCHSSTGEGDAKGYLNMGIFGQYLNSRGHRNDKILCSTCHGEPHALYPSTLPADNAQIEALQNDPRPIGVCDTCHTGKSSTWGKPPH